LNEKLGRNTVGKNIALGIKPEKVGNLTVGSCLLCDSKLVDGQRPRKYAHKVIGEMV